MLGFGLHVVTAFMRVRSHARMVYFGYSSIVEYCTKLLFSHIVPESVGGVMVSIVAFQAVDPGSIPGQRIFLPFIFHQPLITLILVHQVGNVYICTSHSLVHPHTL